MEELCFTEILVNFNVLSDILIDDTDAALTTVTDGGGETKTVQCFTSCNTPVETALEALSVRLCFDNFNALTWQERQDSIVELTAIAAARAREQALLTKLDALCTAVTSGTTLGARRDVLTTLSALFTNERVRLRLPGDARFRVVLPQQLVAALVADAHRQMPGDGEIAKAEAQVLSELSSIGANVTVTMDDSVPAAQAAAAVQDPFDTTAWTIRVYPEGTFVFGGGQSITTGVVRDSAHNDANTFETFEEQWETLFKVGGNPAFKLTATLCASGASSGTATVTCT